MSLLTMEASLGSIASTLLRVVVFELGRLGSMMAPGGMEPSSTSKSTSGRAALERTKASKRERRNTNPRILMLVLILFDLFLRVWELALLIKLEKVLDVV